MALNVIDGLFTNNLRIETFKALLDMLLGCPDGGEILARNADKVIKSFGKTIFHFILMDEYRELFVPFLKKNADTLFKMVDFKGTKVIDELCNKYPKIVFNRALYLLKDNDAFERNLWAISSYFGRVVFRKYKECILDEFKKQDVEIDKKRGYRNFIYFMKAVPLDFINEHFDEISELYRKFTDSIVNDNSVMYNFNERSRLLNSLRDIAQKDERLKEFINRDKRILVSFLTSFDISFLKNEGIYEFLSRILEELEMYAGCGIEGITVNFGSSSMVLIWGDLVLKINEGVKSIPYDPVLLRPLIRTNIHFRNSQSVMFGLEIYNRVKTTDLDEEGIYQVFARALKRGVYLGDIADINVGILMDMNVPHLAGACRKGENGEALPYDVEDEDVNLDYYGGSREVLDAGEYAYLDLEDVHKIQGFNVDEFIESLLSKCSVEDIAEVLYSKLTSIHNDRALEYLKRYVREYKQEKEVKLLKFLPKEETKN